MIKAKLIRLIESHFNGTNATADGRSKYHPLYIEQFFSLAFNHLMYRLFRADLSNFDQYCKTYTNITIQQDTATGIWYSLLPVPVVQLPDAANGVRRISGMQNNNSIEFIPLKRDSWDIWASNNVAVTSKEIGYSVRIDRVEYYKKPLIDTMEVKMDIVPLFDSYEDTDNIPIPSGADIDLFQIIQQLMSGRMPSDKVNNNIPN